MNCNLFLFFKYYFLKKNYFRQFLVILMFASLNLSFLYYCNNTVVLLECQDIFRIWYNFAYQFSLSSKIYRILSSYHVQNRHMIQFTVRQSCKHVDSLAFIISRKQSIISRVRLSPSGSSGTSSKSTHSAQASSSSSSLIASPSSSSSQK